MFCRILWVLLFIHENVRPYIYHLCVVIKKRLISVLPILCIWLCGFAFTPLHDRFGVKSVHLTPGKPSSRKEKQINYVFMPTNNVYFHPFREIGIGVMPTGSFCFLAVRLWPSFYSVLPCLLILMDSSFASEMNSWSGLGWCAKGSLIYSSLINLFDSVQLKTRKE
jgi:hypothetical protein